MDAPTPPPAPLGPMTRARAKAIEDKVNSLLSELPLSTHETWLLPKSEMLCMIRYHEGPPEDAHEDGQVPKSTDEENQRKEPRASPRPWTSSQGPGYPAPGAPSSTATQSQKATGPGHPAPTTRTSSLSRAPGYPATGPEIRPLRTREQQMPPLLPGHPASPESPDIRPNQPGHPASPVCAQ